MYASIGIAITAHASMLLLLNWGLDVKRPMVKSEPEPQEPFFAVEFHTQLTPVPEPESQPGPQPESQPQPQPQPGPGPQPESEPGPGPEPEPQPESQPQPQPQPGTGLGISVAEIGPSEVTLAPGTSTSAPHAGSRFSLSMRSGSRTNLDGRQGSLLDDAIAAASVPEQDLGQRGDLIVLPGRIGLHSRTGSPTKWRATGEGGMTSVHEPFTATIANDGRISFADRDPLQAELVRWHGIPMPMAVGKFDLTDAAMAAFGDVLYPYRKLRAMDQTREFRAAMAVRARGESLQSALGRFDKDLSKIWRDRSRSASERRAILFALWDECAEQGPEDVTKTATAIRAMIVDFVVSTLPERSGKGYSAKELNAFNAQRQSTRAFDPYR